VPVAFARASPLPSLSRKGLKHGGYFNRADVEKFAVLRARLELDNSQLISLAIDELFLRELSKGGYCAADTAAEKKRAHETPL
jgi:hypothetical protein